MVAFVIRRLAFAVLLVIAAASFALLLTRAAPGDVTLELGPLAERDEIAATRRRFDLDRSPLAQWAGWATRAVRFDFGESYLYNRPVGPIVAAAAANTAALGTAALVVATVAGLALGIVTGSRAGGAAVGMIRVGSAAALSLPPLLTALLLTFMAARTRWLPIGGMSSAAAMDQTWPLWLADVARHLPLPVLALALPLAATFERLQSQALRDALHQPFAAAAAARGVSADRIVLRHAWPVSLRAICGVYGVAVGTLLSGSFVVEFVTAWPGLGRLMYEALRARDIYLVAGCAATGSIFLASGTLIGDLLLAVVDPRAREGLT